MDKNKIGIVILSAGKGTRLGCTDIPKVMLEIGGKPIVSHVVEQLESLGLSSEQICLVVGFCKEKVMEHFGDRVSFAHQTELKGTAHAAYTGMTTLPKSIEHVLVMGGDDSAFYTAQTLEKLIAAHIENEAKLTLLTAVVENCAALGRIVRDQNGKIEIIEKEYLTEEQKLIKEISTGTFVFDRKWFEEMFPSMPMLKKLGEYGLPTALAVARENNLKHQVIALEDSGEWFGVNTPEELAEARRRKSL